MISNIGTKIKQLRLSKNISQKDLCKDMINRTILSHIENNKMYPSLPQLEYITNKLNVPISYFFDYEDVLYNINNTNQTEVVFEDLFKQKKYDEIIKFYKKESTLKLNLLTFYFVGMSFFHLNIFNESLTYLRKFIYRYTKSNQETKSLYCIQSSIALNTLFKLMLYNKNYEKGIRYLLLAKKFIYQFDIIDSEISCIIHSNLAYAYILKSKFKNTIDLLEGFLSFNKNIIYANIIPDMHLTLNIAYYNIGDYKASLVHINKSKFFYNYIGKTELANLVDLNIINIYRYDKQIHEAFQFLNQCKSKYCHDINIYQRFLMQECILWFNIKKFDNVNNVLKIIKFNELNSFNKKDFLYMKGHISFINKDYIKSKNYFKKCIKHYIANNFNYDLSLIYSDLYSLEHNDKYLKLVSDLKVKPTEKNILCDWFI